MDLSIAAGERIVVIGPRAPARPPCFAPSNFLETIDEGEILFDGRPAGYRRDRKGRLVLERQRTICGLRSQIGMVFQHFHLFPHMNRARET